MKKYNSEEIREVAEYLTFKRLITEIYPSGIVSVVADTFDYWKALTKFAAKLKDEIMQRDGKVVFRPDTGDPVKVVVGYTWRDVDGLRTKDFANALNEEEYQAVRFDGKFYTIGSGWDSINDYVEIIELSAAEVKGSIECLWEIFGGTVSAQGYKMLDPHVGLIYGDSITLERAQQICEGLKKKGFASTNIVFGIGSYTYQYVTRDTDGYAVKATFAKIDGVNKEIFKSPKGASFKKSAKGLTAVYKDADGEFYLKDQATWDEVNNCEFVKVFENGELLKDWTLAEIRSNLAKHI